MPVKFRQKFSVEKAHRMQLRLSKRVIHEDQMPDTIDYVAGVDVAYTRETSIAAVAVLDYNSLSLVESQVAHLKTRFPYISTLLSFRELPPALSATNKLRVQPDVFLVDGHGIAHPYRFGFSTHFGLTINKPTIGVAKSLLCGKVESLEKQGWEPITDKGEVIGAALVTKSGRQPIYISVGHRVSLEKAIDIVIDCTRNCKIPEPIRTAHIIANEEKGKLGLTS